ncbi:DUF6221 family protein [Streptomyces sp. NPDC058268]|uniref:DUF6221 family protein n=1 Tax=Streptomyces sp. NPDC058268 TaxID=3346413 RepID=UPI0036F15D8F
MTADLIAFLRARYSELAGTCDWAIEAQRLLSELEMYYITGEEQHPLYGVPDWQVAFGGLRLSALAFADHPDYREEWRP